MGPYELLKVSFLVIQFHCKIIGIVKNVLSRTNPLINDFELFNGGWSLKVEVLRCRGSHEGGTAELEIDEHAGTIREAGPGDLAAELAHRAAHGGQARA